MIIERSTCLFTTIICYIVSASGGYTLILTISDIVRYIWYAGSLDRSIDRIELKLHLRIEYIYMCARACNSTSTKPTAASTSVRSIDAKQESVRSDAYEYALETRSIGRSVIIGCSFAKRRFVGKLRSRRFDEVGLSWIGDWRDVHQETKKRRTR